MKYYFLSNSIKKSPAKSKITKENTKRSTAKSIPLAPPPAPPPPPPLSPQKPLTFKQTKSIDVDLQSRAKTIRIGKVRWPPAPVQSLTFEYELQK